MTRIEEERIDEMLADEQQNLEYLKANDWGVGHIRACEKRIAVLLELKELRAQGGVRVEEDFTNYAYAAEDGWIEWSGGGCPVSLGAKVDYRDRGRQNGYFTAQAGALNWAHGGHSGDIVAYRLSALETEAIGRTSPAVEGYWSSDKTYEESPRTEAVQPEWFAVNSVTGSHVGMWRDEKIARRVFEQEYPNGALIPLYAHPPLSPVPIVTGEMKFKLGDWVQKTKGSSWRGHVVGFYSTTLTPIGYCVESNWEPGSVQIYPESALSSEIKP